MNTTQNQDRLPVAIGITSESRGKFTYYYAKVYTLVNNVYKPITDVSGTGAWSKTVAIKRTALEAVKMGLPWASYGLGNKRQGAVVLQEVK